LLHFINPSKTFNVGKVKGRTDIIKNLTIEEQYVQKYINLLYIGKNQKISNAPCRVANMWMDNVTLTFDLQTSISIGFLLSPWIGSMEAKIIQLIKRDKGVLWSQMTFFYLPVVRLAPSPQFLIPVQIHVLTLSGPLLIIAALINM
jgi:hypothetical protein